MHGLSKGQWPGEDSDSLKMLCLVCGQADNSRDACSVTHATQSRHPQVQVCLSLLGTWHGGTASEKWNPDTSGIFQILLSVQVGQRAARTAAVPHPVDADRSCDQAPRCMQCNELARVAFHGPAFSSSFTKYAAINCCEESQCSKALHV